MLKTFRLAAKFLWREWRAGEWFVVCIALLLAIIATTSIHFYIDRLTRGLDLQGAKFLGGDLVISSSTPIPNLWIKQAETLQLRVAEVWSYPSVVSTKNQLQLVNLQAVSENYPLIGDAGLQPQRATIWVEPRLLPLLAIKMNDSVKIGAASFRVERVLSSDIDTLNTGWTIAPRVLMRLSDVPATQTVLLGSRVDYRLLIVGDKIQLQQFRDWLTPQLVSGQVLLDVHNQQFALRNILQRTESYLQLVLLVCILMSGVAIALSIQQYMRRHAGYVALWRCLGAKQVQITRIFLYQLLIISVVSGAIAVVFGYLAQAIFANLFREFLQFPLPAASAAPALLGLLTSIFLLFTFAYPIIYELPRTSPLFIWRNEVSVNYLRSNFYLIISLIIISIFIYWFMNFSLLALYFLSCLLMSIGILYSLSILILLLLKIVLVKTEGAVRRGLSQLVQYPKSVSLQFVGFNLILISLIVLGQVRAHLIESWQQSLSTHAPNYFAINIAPSDLDNFRKFFSDHKVSIEWIYPMVRGRLMTLNGKAILSVVPASAMNNNALHRELNLSWMWQYPDDNKIVSGNAWAREDAGKALVSVEKKLADDLQLHLGDRLTFQIGDQQISAVISNLRTLEWSSFHPNFFMIFPPGLLDSFPTTYITSFHLGSNQTLLLNQLVQVFPSVTVIDVANILQQMQDLLGKIVLAMQYLFLFALGAGVLIFVTSLQASMDERRQTYLLLRVLGASKKYIRKSYIVEFGLLTILIVFSAMGFSSLIVFLLEYKVFTI